MIKKQTVRLERPVRSSEVDIAARAIAITAS